MNIYINEQKLDTKLDGETNLGQVLEEIQKWIESNGKYLRHFTINGKEKDRSELFQLGIGEEDRLDLFVGEELDVVEDSLWELDTYVEKIGSTLVGRDSLTEKESKDLQEGIPWIISMIESTKNILNLNLSLIRPMGKGKNVEEILDSLLQGAESLDTTSSIEAFLEDLRDLKLFLIDLGARLSVMRLEESELITIINGFLKDEEKILKDLVAINENFQAGKDFLASEIMNDVVGRLNSLLSSLVSLQGRHPEITWNELEIHGESFTELLANLNNTLSEIASAMEKNDIVFAGDVFEYELPEKIQMLNPFLKEMLERIKTN